MLPHLKVWVPQTPIVLGTWDSARVHKSQITPVKRPRVREYGRDWMVSDSEVTIFQTFFKLLELDAELRILRLRPPQRTSLRMTRLGRVGL